MADWIDTEVLEQGQNPELSGVVDTAGRMGDMQSVVPAVHAAVGALDEDDDDVFYCEKDILLDDCIPAGARSTPEPNCQGGPALAPEELTFVWPVVRAVESTETQTEMSAEVHAAGVLTSSKGYALEDVTGRPVDLVPVGPTHQGPTEPQVQTSKTVSPDVPGDAHKVAETQPEAWIPSKEEPVSSLEQRAQGTPLPYAAAAAAPGEVNHPNGERECLAEMPRKELLGENLHKGDEEMNEPESPGEQPTTGGRKKSTSHDTCSKYNTVSYRKIRKGNTKQKINEFESMMNT